MLVPTSPILLGYLAGGVIGGFQGFGAWIQHASFTIVSNLPQFFGKAI
jgi:hypothetical protein